MHYVLKNIECGNGTYDNKLIGRYWIGRFYTTSSKGIYSSIYLSDYLDRKLSSRSLHFSNSANFSSNFWTVTFTEAYKDFDNIFVVENAGQMPLHKDYNHAIDLVNYKKLPYKLIYSLSETRSLFFGHILIKTWLRNLLDCLSFLQVPLFSFCLSPIEACNYVSITGLSTNLTVKNQYSFLLIGKSLDELGRAKQFTKLDLTNAY